MELQFQKMKCRCLKRAVGEVRNQEQTQEIRLSEGMPDVGRVVGAWGQIIARGKEWRSDSVSFSGGCMVWVLYVPEDDSEPRMLDAWVPFQMKWDLPGSAPEGDIRVNCRIRSVDARSVSPRKILVRIGTAAMGEAFVPMETEISIPENVPEDVYLLPKVYPVRLPREAGEKVFSVEEELSLPSSAPEMENLLAYSLEPKVTERKIMAGRMVFRGNGELHILYRGEDGLLHSRDLSLPFSQLAELEGEYGSDARADVNCCVSALEIQREDDGKWKLKSSIVAQYLIDDRENLTLIEDAYSNRRPVQLQPGELELPVILDSGSVNLYGEQTIPMKAGNVVDTRFYPDAPRTMREEDGISAELNGQYQMVYYDENGTLQGTAARWEDRTELPAAPGSRVYTDLEVTEPPAVTMGADEANVSSELRLHQQTVSNTGIPMVMGLELGEVQEPDPLRPSLILRRAGENGLWELAKMSGSTMEAIRGANALTDEPVPGQLLLIPVN